MSHIAQLQNTQNPDYPTLEVSIDNINFERLITASPGHTVPITVKIPINKQNPKQPVHVNRGYEQLLCEDQKLVDVDAHMIHVHGKPSSVPMKGGDYPPNTYIEIEIRGIKIDTIF